MPPVDPEIERLLAHVVETAERLEVLLLLRREQPSSFTAKTLCRLVSIAPSTADTHLAVLCGRGFLGVTIGSDLTYSYQPISPKIDQQVATLAQLCKERRAEVVALLGKSRAVSPATAFADAFRFRKGNDDG